MKHEGEFERFEYAGRTVVLCFDPDAESPRDNDGNIATIASWHLKVKLGERQLTQADGVDWSDRQATVKALEADGDKVLAILPVWIYQHSGIFLKAAATRPPYPFDCKWDAGQVGWAYVLKSNADKCGVTPLADEPFLNTAIMQEVEVYDRWGRGEFAGYIVEDEDGVELDSCWGFDDVDYCREQAKEAAEAVRAPGQVDGGETATCEGGTT